jgi:flagellar hook assembly protein FlgD
VDAPVADAGGVDPFWNQPGRLLEEKLVIGSPNPFRDQVTIEYEIPTRVVDEEGVEHTLSGAALPTSVKVYNVAGRLVATLVETEHSPGRYRTEWTAINETGSTVASGVYYVKLQIGKRTVTMRMVQIK